MKWKHGTLIISHSYPLESCKWWFSIVCWFMYKLILLNSTRNFLQPASVRVFHPGAGLGSIPLWTGTVRLQRCEAGEDCRCAGGCVDTLRGNTHCWFGTWLWFSIVYGYVYGIYIYIFLPIDFHIFQRGRSTTNQMMVCITLSEDFAI